MKMFYYLVRYSFATDKPVFGPFNTYEDAWVAALADAKKEFDIDKNESGWDAEMVVHEDYGEVILIDHFTNYTHTTAWILFEI